MAYLMHLAFDNVGRLERRSYLFEYQGICFKLVQDNPRKYADHLMTVLPEGTLAQRQRAFAVASDFLASLAWQNRVPTGLLEAGGRGWHHEWPLKDAKPSMFTFPRIPFHGNLVGYKPNILPKIETPQQRLALTLFREAGASNNFYLSFLFYWEILRILGNPVRDVQRMIRKSGRPPIIPNSDLSDLPLDGRTLGAYLEDDCRNAVAHVVRRAGKRNLKLDGVDDRARMDRSTRVVERLARHFIETTLDLREVLHLVRTSDSKIPVYVDSAFLHREKWRPAYPSLNNGLRSGTSGRTRKLQTLSAAAKRTSR